MNALLNEAKSSTADHTKMPETGGDFELPPAGPTPARFIGYVEMGLRAQKPYQGKEKKPAHMAWLFFELNGKKHQIVGDDGTVRTNRVMIRSVLLTGERAKFGKLFRAMRNGRAEITNMAQMLGEGFLVHVFHNVVGEGAEARTYVNLTDAEGVWKVGPPIFVNPMDPENVQQVPVPEPTQPLMLLLWDNPSKAQWDSIFIDGTRTVKDEKGQEKEVSKNWMQEDILKNAINISESALADVLGGLGDLDLKPDPVTDAAAEQAALVAAQKAKEEKVALAKAEAAKADESGAAGQDEASQAKEPEKAAPAAPAASSADDVLATLGL